MTFAKTTEWAKLLFDASLLCADASMVIALRSWWLMAGGPIAQRELERMFSEKVEAGFELAGAIAGGTIANPEALARKAIGIYGKRVRGNCQRLG